MAKEKDGYRYVGLNGETIDPNKEYKFDNSYVEQLCNSHRYREAADYYRRFQFNNSEFQQQVWNKIDELDEAARKEDALYYKVEDKKIISNIRFADAVYQPGAVEAMRKAKNDKGNYIYATDAAFNKENPYAGKYRDIWNRLGSADSRTVSMDISIPKIKRGLFGADWTVKDKDDDVNIFNLIKTKFGLTRDEILASGITYDTQDPDNFKYHVPKDSPYAVQFMYAVGVVNHPYSIVHNKAVITGYDEKGRKTSQTKKYQVYGYGSSYNNYYYGNNSIISGNHYETLDRTDDLNKLVELIDRAENLKTNAIAKLNKEEPIRTSGTKFQLSLIKTVNDKQKVVDYCKTHALTSNHERYLATNGGNLEKSTDQDDYEKFMKDFAARGVNEVNIEGYTNNGLTGVLITLYPLQDSKTGEAKGDVQQMFIPNYLMKVVGYDANKRTDIKAKQEVNNMKNYGPGYKYTFSDGTVAYIDEGGNIRRNDFSEEQPYIDDSADAFARLERNINEDYIIKQAGREIVKFTNSNNEVDRNILEYFAQTIAIKAADEFYPSVLNRDISGNKLDESKLFTNRALIQQNINKDYNNTVREKLEELYSIYDSIINNALRLYNPINR